MALVEVRVKDGLKISEMGQIFTAGQTFKTTPARAAQLAAVVTIVAQPAPVAENRQVTPNKVETGVGVAPVTPPAPKPEPPKAPAVSSPPAPASPK